MNKNFLIIIVLFLLIVPTTINAQNKKMEKANDYLDAGEYFKARDLYVKLYAKAKTKEEKAEISYKVGYCSRHLMDVQQSVTWFKRAILYKYQEPLTNLYLADAYKMKGNYDEAKKYYANYKDLVPGDQRADDGIKSCDLAVEWIANPSRYIIKSINTLNSRQNDFAPAIAKDTNTIYFTSTRESTDGSNFNNNSGQNFADIFVSKKNTRGQWSQPIPVTGSLNSEFDDGSCTLEADGHTMYFTYCAVVQNANSGCKIFKSTLSGDQWGTPEKVEIFADSSISTGQPSISPDQLTMFFVSDNPQGSFGGKDIWKVTRSSKTADWGTPVNMGADINTKADELYPVMDKEGNLYFSTDGRLGMGGLDIYKATPDGDTWDVQNLKYPLNSSANDFGLTFNQYDNNLGFVTSSRSNGKGDDVFSFYLKPIYVTLNGYVRNDANKGYLDQVNVEITGSDGSVTRVVTNDLGAFTARLSANIDYSIITSKKTYLKATGSVSTKGITDDGKVFETEIFMRPGVGVVKIPNIRYDFNDTTLREESKVALDELIDILTINPTAKIELRANTDYRGSDAANMVLSQGRANAVVEYLVENGIDKSRLVAKGMGETTPFTVDAVTASTYPFLKKDDVLTESFITSLSSTDEQEICNELNRRTEFKVLSIDWGDSYETFGD